MIRIHRGPEPTVLADARARHLAAARIAHAAGDPIAFEGHEVVKDDLFAMQARKCCYCEKLEEQPKYRDVEHFRPKSTYWWLAWTWENLLFSCIDCNREYKREQFPLAPGSTALVAEQAPPGGEAPRLIDPCDAAVDPFDEIEFRRERVQSNERWVPYGLTPRGSETIRVCGLDRHGLLTWYSNHVRDAVRPKISPISEAHRRRDAQGVVRAWSTALRGLFAPTRPFRALSHDALKVLVSTSLREQYHLALARPR